MQLLDLRKLFNVRDLPFSLPVKKGVEAADKGESGGGAEDEMEDSDSSDSDLVGPPLPPGFGAKSTGGGGPSQLGRVRGEEDEEGDEEEEEEEEVRYMCTVQMCLIFIIVDLYRSFIGCTRYLTRWPWSTEQSQ